MGSSSHFIVPHGLRPEELSSWLSKDLRLWAITLTWLRCSSSRPSVFPRPASPQDQPRLATSLVVPNPALPPSVVPLFPPLFFYLSTPAFPPSVTTHHSSWIPKEIAPPLFFFLCLFVSPSGVTPDSLLLFLSFPESEISEDRLPSVFVRVVSPVERGSGKTPKNLRLYRWLVLFLPAACAAFLSFVATDCPAIAGSPFLYPFPFLPGLSPDLSLFLFPLVVSANSLTGLPNLVSAWFLLSGGSIPLQSAIPHSILCS